MTQIRFEKAIERDGTFVTQQLFARNLTEDLATEYDIDSPYRPIVLHFANKENIQLFENKESLHWIQDRLLERNLESVSFITSVLDRHRALLPRIEEVWRQTKLSPAQFEKYKTLAREATLNISIYYYAGIDERTPKPIQDAIVEIRKTDEFGVRNDEFVRNCVAAKGIDGELTRVLLLSELLAPDEVVLKERIKGAWLVDGQLEGKRYDDFISAHPGYLFENHSSTVAASEVKGQVAQKGMARGKVKIVKNRNQASGVGEGDILVSPMTQPDFIQAMSRAAAFVTDEGGVVCHAAIIAREMKKPCIVGTKVATQMFKDGDMVEVDAEKGIIRKI